MFMLGYYVIVLFVIVVIPPGEEVLEDVDRVGQEQALVSDKWGQH